MPTKPTAVIAAAALVICFLAAPALAEGGTVTPSTFGTDLVSLEEAELVARASRTSLEQQLVAFLGEVRMERIPRFQRSSFSAENRAERLADDPALTANLGSIRDEWFLGLAAEHQSLGLLYSSFEELVQAKIMIARNLYFRGLEPSRETVRAEYPRILEQRRRYAGLELFAERSVVYAASAAEVADDGSYVFGRDITKRRVERQAGDVTFLRGEGRRSADELDQALGRASHLTFLFEGHGRDGSLEFSNSISAAELAGRLAGSSEAPIVIPVSCRSHTFSRSVISELQRRSALTPITITPVEFGQDYLKGVYDDAFLRRDLRLGRGTSTTLGSLIDGAGMATSVYVPDESNVPMQIL